MTEDLDIVGVEDKCMAKCPKRATEAILIGGQDFKFCQRCADNLREPVEKYNDEADRILEPIR